MDLQCNCLFLVVRCSDTILLYLQFSVFVRASCRTVCIVFIEGSVNIRQYLPRAGYNAVQYSTTKFNTEYNTVDDLLMPNVAHNMNSVFIVAWNDGRLCVGAGSVGGMTPTVV